MTMAQVAGRLARAVGLHALPDMAKKYLTLYQAPTGPRSALRAECFEPVERTRGTALDTPSISQAYHEWAGVPGGHKWLHYFEEYDDLFTRMREVPIRMLEIGVYRGASLQTWRRYLHADSVIVGIDIDPSCEQFDNPDQQVHVRIGSQADPVFLADVVDEFGPFDVILDDGSHICSHMIASFSHLFLPALAERGLYIAEDTHTNFWSEYRDQRYSFVDLCKDLVDVMNSHYAEQPSEPAYRIGHPEQRAAMQVSRLSAQIKEISFRDSIIAIRKKPVGRLPASQHN